MEVVTAVISTAFLLQTIRIFSIYYLASTAGSFSENAGILNIALEGFLIFGAFVYAVININTGQPLMSLALSILVSALFAALFGFFTITLKAEHIVTGVGFNLLAAGFADFFMIYLFSSSSSTPRVQKLTLLPVFSLLPSSDVFANIIIIISFLLLPVSFILLYRTSFGLRLRAAGESAYAVSTFGIDPNIYKYGAIIICGMLTCLAGVWLVDNQSSYSDGMTAGRGFIAIAAMIIGRKRPLPVLLASLLFAVLESLEVTFQIAAPFIPGQLLQIMPYILTIVILIFYRAKN